VDPTEIRSPKQIFRDQLRALKGKDTLAAFATRCGAKQSTVRDWLNAKYMPRAGALTELAKRLDRNERWLQGEPGADASPNQKLAGDDLARDVGSEVLREAFARGKTDEWLRDLAAPFFSGASILDRAAGDGETQLRELETLCKTQLFFAAVEGELAALDVGDSRTAEVLKWIELVAFATWIKDGGPAEFGMARVSRFRDALNKRVGRDGAPRMRLLGSDDLASTLSHAGEVVSLSEPRAKMSQRKANQRAAPMILKPSSRRDRPRKRRKRLS
jgi:transcriptional regulator with XRE-family HTH domain